MNWKERRHKRLRKRAQLRGSLAKNKNYIRYAYKGRWKKVFVYLSIYDRHRRQIDERT